MHFAMNGILDEIEKQTGRAPMKPLDVLKGDGVMRSTVTVGDYLGAMGTLVVYSKGPRGGVGFSVIVDGAPMDTDYSLGRDAELAAMAIDKIRQES